MKKVILCAAALMIGSFAFAQHVPEKPTLAIGQTAVPNNSPNPKANTGESVQSGHNQKVRVRQVGTKNSAETKQDDGTGTGGNLALIEQNGANTANSGEENRSKIVQSGTANQAYSRQEGDFNHSVINQGQNDAASAGNKAYVQQGTGNLAENNRSEVQQDGNDNQSRTVQRFDNNEAKTTQNGTLNKSDIFQNAKPNLSSGHAAEVTQYGVNNTALLNQDGNGATNMATTRQDGNGNASVQNQFNTATSGGAVNMASVDQGVFLMEGPAVGLYADLLVVDDIHNGTFNPGSQGAIARQEQKGADNAAQASQFGQFNQSYQEQLGDGNRALVVQNAYGNTVGQSNRARQEQTGDDNAAAIGQNWTGHTALQVQVGNKNKALSTQRGNDNLANINQFGDKNWASTAQRGQHNVAFINQYDGQSYSVQQNLADGYPNGGNQADILQQGPGGTATGMYNCDVPYVDPGTFNDIPDLNLPDLCGGSGGSGGGC